MTNTSPGRLCGLGVCLDVGWLRQPIRKQLAAYTVPPMAVFHLEKDVDAVLRLHIRGLLNDRGRDAALRAAIKRFAKEWAA